MILKVFVETVMDVFRSRFRKQLSLRPKAIHWGARSLTRPELTAGAPLSFFRLWHGGTTVGLARRVPGPHL